MTLDAVYEFLAAPAGIALKAMLLWAFLDFATGTFAALKDGTFALDVIGAFIRKHILGRVMPLALLLASAHFTNDIALSGAAIAGAAAYTLETMSSVKGNFFPPQGSDAKAAEAKAVGNPVPTE